MRLSCSCICLLSSTQALGIHRTLRLPIRLRISCLRAVMVGVPLHRFWKLRPKAQKTETPSKTPASCVKA